MKILTIVSAIVTILSHAVIYYSKIGGKSVPYRKRNILFKVFVAGHILRAIGACVFIIAFLISIL